MHILITGGNGNLATILKTSLSSLHNVESPGRDDFNLLNFDSMKQYLQNKTFDVVIHTAIQGGRRTKPDTSEHVYNNIIMLENLLWFKDHFKMIINLDSGAIYNREEDIFKRKEIDIYSIPKDYYGFSKYMTYQRGLACDNFFNMRIFNIFHETEEPDRFIARCVNIAKNGGLLEIYENKYFDFFYKDDFVSVVKYYIDNVGNKENLFKTLNLSYEEKHTLADIAKMIIGADADKQIIVHNDKREHNYCGDNSLLKSMNIEYIGLEHALQIYKKVYVNNSKTC
jgi:nucleoside-diphosphate-sugar epimerase